MLAKMNHDRCQVENKETRNVEVCVCKEIRAKSLSLTVFEFSEFFGWEDVKLGSLELMGNDGKRWG